MGLLIEDGRRSSCQSRTAPEPSLELSRCCRCTDQPYVMHLNLCREKAPGSLGLLSLVQAGIWTPVFGDRGSSNVAQKLKCPS